MKIRSGFVSNSSSSSFTCDICKKTVVLYDGEGSEDYLTCEEGHEVCACHVKNKATAKQMREALGKYANENYEGEELTNELKEIEGYDSDELSDYFYESFGGDLPSVDCPLCQFKTLTDDDLVDYLLMSLNTTKKEALKDATTRFKNYDEFCAALKTFKKQSKNKPTV